MEDVESDAPNEDEEEDDSFPGNASGISQKIPSGCGPCMNVYIYRYVLRVHVKGTNQEGIRWLERSGCRNSYGACVTAMTCAWTCCHEDLETVLEAGRIGDLEAWC